MDTFVLDLLIFLDYTNLLSSNECEKNDKTIPIYFQYLETKIFLLWMHSKKMEIKTIYCIKCNKHSKIKNSIVSYRSDKTFVFFIF